MNGLLLLGIISGSLIILAACWLGWQLMRQNGRLLLRLGELEKRLNELEFDEDAEPAGLTVGTEAPAFELPNLTGERHTLAQFRGQPVVLIFFNPECGFCRELVPKLAALPPHPVPLPVGRGEGGRSPGEGFPLPSLLIVTTGDTENNFQFFSHHKVGFPVLFQRDGATAKAYQANGTPSGYLISADGKIASPLAMGAEALLELAAQPDPLTPTLSPSEGARENPGNGVDGLAGRFSQRSVARSKIKRDGLKAGTLAPDFRLPRLDGRGDLTLNELHGKRVLLVFSSPGCGPCDALAPELEKFHRSQTDREVGRVTPCAPLGDGGFRDGAQRTARPTLGISVVMISKGEPKENRAKVKEHGLTFPVVLQQQWEISRRYAMFATPVAYLIDEAGIITNDVAIGLEPILNLVTNVSSTGQLRSCSLAGPIPI